MGKLIINEFKLFRRMQFIWLIGLCLPFIWQAAYAQEENDLQALIQETQKMSQNPDDMTLVWWIPSEFWRLSLAKEAQMTQAQVDEILKTTSPYTILLVVDASMGSFGGLTYKSEQTIRDSIKVKDMKGRIYLPLAANAISADTRNFLQMIKPILEEMLGPMGQNMHFFLFPAKGKDGEQIVNSTAKGRFSVYLGSKEFAWRLPLDSLIPIKTCPKCSELCKGSWEYCPWCGAKLSK